MQGKWGVFRGAWNLGVGHIAKETEHFYMLTDRPTGGLYSKRMEKDRLLHTFDTEEAAEAAIKRHAAVIGRAKPAIADAEAALRTLKEATRDNALAALKAEA